MRTIRIYQAGQFRVGDNVALDKTQAQHVATVLRMRENEHLRLFDGDNREFEAKIVSVRKNQVSLELLEVFDISLESPKNIHLAQGISKGDKMEFVVQKAVELGVKSIQPVITCFCAFKLDEERKEKKLKQWQAIAIAACEQSGRNVVPVVHPIVSLTTYVRNKVPMLDWVLEPQAEKSWRDYAEEMKASHDMGLLIGPEGGLHSDEIGLLLDHGFRPLSLGPRVLRTETAALAAITMLQAICGDI